MNIIQIGANRGNDDLTPIIMEHKHVLKKVILIEPLSVLHPALKRCYEGINVDIVGKVITDNTSLKELSFYYTEKDAPNYEISSLSRMHLVNHGVNPDEIQEEKVECISINDLMRQYKLRKVDLLFIDAEGFDEAIIRSIDFKNFTIQQIIYESLHVASKEKLIQFLSLKNYLVSAGWGLNGWSSAAIKQPSGYKFTLRYPYLHCKYWWVNNRKSIAKKLKSLLFQLGLFHIAKSIKVLFFDKNNKPNS